MGSVDTADALTADALASALLYLNRGFSVIPVQGKVPLVPWQAWQTERPSGMLVREWWATYPDANVGIVTGAVSGLVVVDIDGQIEQPWTWLAESGIVTLGIPIVHTGGGGLHLYYRHPGTPIRNGVRLGMIKDAAVDVRGDGGYVVAPPSIHRSGRPYVWTQPIEGPLLPLPDSFKSLILDRTPPAEGPLSASSIDAHIMALLDGVPAGGRNHAAAQVAGWWLKVTHGDVDATRVALQIWNTRNTPPLPDRELEATLLSIARADAVRGERLHAAKSLTLSGADWAASVRDVPPRKGTPAPTIPVLETLGGLVPRDLIVLAGRPGMGKSTCAWGVVIDAALHAKVPTIIFSTEMTSADVARWVACRLSSVPVKDLTSAHWNAALDLIAQSPVRICDQGGIGLGQIVETVRQYPETRLVVVDHLQRIAGPGRENRNQELGHIAQGLKSLAKDLPCTVLVLSQMNRAGDHGDRPRLGMLRDSGEIEQEADAVIFLWSDAEDITVTPLKVEFYLAKNRHGSLETVEALFNKPLKTFAPVDITRRLASLKRDQENKERLNAMMSGNLLETP